MASSRSELFALEYYFTAAILFKKSAHNSLSLPEYVGPNQHVLQVKDTLYDETLGGTFVTAVIAEYIVKTSKVDIRGNKRALAKVFSQAEKVGVYG